MGHVSIPGMPGGSCQDSWVALSGVCQVGHVSIPGTRYQECANGSCQGHVSIPGTHYQECAR